MMKTTKNTNSLPNDFQPFATGTDANVTGQADYEQSAFLKTGFQKGLARSSELNKALRQSSSIAAAVAQFTADKTGEAVIDNGDVATLSRQLETAIATVSPRLIAEAAGTADAVTAVFTPALTQLVNGLPVHVRAAFKNTTVSPTFNADATGAKPVVKGNNRPLAVGDIAGPGHWLALQYDAGLDKWVLQNPATGVVAGGVPVGSVDYFAMETPPAGYLKADGSAVGRETYPALFAVIGTMFGEGDGKTTFNVPDLIGRFAEGSAMPGVVKEAGLPNISAEFGAVSGGKTVTSGAVKLLSRHLWTLSGGSNDIASQAEFSAADSNPIYGASDTVQPPALTLLPCIKAFDAIADSALIDVSALAQETAGKVDRTVNGKNIAYVVDSWRSGAAYWRLWSDGWLEQGGTFGPIGIASTGHRYETINLFKPYDDQAFRVVLVPLGEPYLTPATCLYDEQTTTSIKVGGQDWDSGYVYWYTCGMAVPS